MSVQGKIFLPVHSDIGMIFISFFFVFQEKILSVAYELKKHSLSFEKKKVKMLRGLIYKGNAPLT